MRICCRIASNWPCANVGLSMPAPATDRTHCDMWVNTPSRSAMEVMLGPSLRHETYSQCAICWYCYWLVVGSFVLLWLVVGCFGLSLAALINTIFNIVIWLLACRWLLRLALACYASLFYVAVVLLVLLSSFVLAVLCWFQVYVLSMSISFWTIF